MQRRIRSRGLAGVIVGLVGLASWSVADAARTRARVTVELAEPFTIGGTTWPGGRLTLRDLRDYNPGTTIHEVEVDGATVGVLMARRGRSEVARPESAAVFRRDSLGRLHLVGYLRAGRETFRFLPDPQGLDGEDVRVAIR